MFALRILKKTFFNSAPSVSNCEGEAIMFECPPHPLLCYAMRHHYDQPTTHIVTHVIFSSTHHNAALRLNNNLHFDPCKNIPYTTTNSQQRLFGPGCKTLYHAAHQYQLTTNIVTQVKCSTMRHNYNQPTTNSVACFFNKNPLPCATTTNPCKIRHH